MSTSRSFGRRKMAFLAASSILVMWSITGILGAKVLPKVSSDETYRYLSLFEEVLSLVRYNYVEPADTRKLMRGAYKGAAEALDPYGAYLTPEELAAQVSEKTKPTGNVGLEVSKRQYILVISTRDGSPAARAGIKSGDYIITVDDRSASDLSVVQAQQAFKGPVGSKLRLSVIRRSSRTGEPEDLELPREEIPRQEMQVARKGEVLHLRIRELEEPDVARVKEEGLKAGEKVPILLDFRNCSNDAMEAAVKLVDLFIDEGEIVRVKTRGKGESGTAASKAPDTLRSPLFLLVNRGSAGAAEIAACALKVHGRAQVLGEKTFGRASIQEIVKLPSGGAVRVTVAKFLSPDGKPIQGEGVDPHERISEPERQTNGSSEEGDPVLEKALEHIGRSNAPAKAG